MAELSAEQKERFLPLCPDFVVALRSPFDRLENLQDKMREYLGNGARLGWLIDPQGRTIYVYEPGKEIRTLHNTEEVSGNPTLSGSCWISARYGLRASDPF